VLAVDTPPAEPLDFTGRVIVVTGGTRGVGAAIARAFLAHGAAVAVVGRHDPGTDSLPSVAVDRGPEEAAAPRRRATFVGADVRDAEQAQAALDAVREAHGRLDVLVNNAGGSPSVPAAEASPRLVAAIVNLNLLGPFYCAQAAYRHMAGQDGGGSIINISSVSGVRPSPGASAYGAAKAGLVSLTQTLAVEWAPLVRVNAVTAGLLDTGAGPEHYGGDDGLARVAATVPLGRMGTPEDIAGICLFLASPLAAYVTGANLVAHGGGEWPAYLTAAAGDPAPG
jgi:NAD(P)-dependent dehydrogenase (short-subunit alcohol dehydrogenase family)